ncbi:chromosome segregation protein SMC [Sulfurirhabdus autotrophica]|uniref:chromosome segregation protein SMC n=1 Tax=Sulfurirhabdus autotrophica TaxID=1706046 RepID=UPI001CB939E9|nr:chromosome segregation protein SMC [Sulfurirhabdus autotrophica]
MHFNLFWAAACLYSTYYYSFKLRLTHIKLAGFKSFVDPTVIPVPGQLVGVVGPNGCGKSNVIDAVRWVLGESSAKQLRGESMQDVIFSGSSGRKPVSRASVELIFDNSLGKAAGQWSQYAEIAVKRILQRAGDSSYYINNIHVRRRDVTDIFMGTGLGARAYAIIEQGMISRIIEARPEELRVFLEEAAGISKYKERRKETESRLSDTRENLLRVDDIRQELDKQIEKLAVQARVAAQYQDLQLQLKTTQSWLWLLRKYESENLRERCEKDILRLTNELEAETATLRESEKRLEEVRANHYSAGDALHDAQGDLYASNAEVAKLEQKVQYQHENRERLVHQIATHKGQYEQHIKNLEESKSNLAQIRIELADVQEHVVQCREQVQETKLNLPLAEEAFRTCQNRMTEIQRNLSQSEQGYQLEEAHRAYAVKTLQQLQARLERLKHEQMNLPQADLDKLSNAREDLAMTEEQLHQFQSELSELQALLPVAEQTKREADHALQNEMQQITRLEAQLHALKQVQNRLDQNKKLQDWLIKHQLENLPRLWQNIQIEPGWENAMESVLRERLNAIMLNDFSESQAWLNDAPPAQVVIANIQQTSALEISQHKIDLVPFHQKTSWKGSYTPALFDAWLSPVFTVEHCAEAWLIQPDLPEGVMVVCKEGHLFTRHSVSFHAQQSEMHGVLARQREIEQLQSDLDHKRAMLSQFTEAHVAADEMLEKQKSESMHMRSRVSEAQQHHHKLQLEVLKLSQLENQVVQRKEQLAQEIEEISAEMLAESEQRESSALNQSEYRAQVEVLREQMDDIAQERSDAENVLNSQREAVNQAEREIQSAEYAERTCISKISVIENSIKVTSENLTILQERLEELQLEQAELGEAPIQLDLQQALAIREEKEKALAMARDYLAELTNSLGVIEKERLISEQKLNPLRDKIGEMRLKEQAAQLSVAQFAEQLHAIDANEAELAATLKAGTKPGVLQAKIVQINEAITELGAVNLAALEELNTAQERQSYLDTQATDLNEAIATLENAIRRIDKETRERLQNTFDVVNRHMGEMFPTLFGGGHARLVLTGDEILDSGIQVIAQPPGKKNSSIHLLSGGEKALTALSLVFSLFQLNPAPFCLLDEVDAPLDDSNTVRFCELVKKMSQNTQFLFISHNKIAMEMAQQLIGVTMQESGVSRVVAVDMENAMRLSEEATV